MRTAAPQRERLWPRRYPWTPAVDLIAKLRDEAQRKVEVHYHVNGAPLSQRPIDPYGRRR
jgi:hypothetical protein